MLANLENVRVIFKNFKGEGSKFNQAGQRNFCAVIDKETADNMAKDGWNIKVLPGREEGEPDTYYLKVKVNFNGPRPPKCYMINGHDKLLLDDATVSELDNNDITAADLVLSAYNWEVNGKSGITAYLRTGYFNIETDMFASKYDFTSDGTNDEDENLPF